MKEIKIALLGLGTVGLGVVEMLYAKRDFFLELGLDFKLTLLARKKDGAIQVLENEAGIPLKDILPGESGGENIDASLKKSETGLEGALKEAAYDVLIECTPTNLETAEPAYSYMKLALARGKSVVTSNKGPIALHYPTLSKLARENQAQVKFETTVLSGTPVFNLIASSLRATKINKISGIFNGTTNYILGQMENGTSYAHALKKAQDLGYAESNPDADVLGLDALAKTIILGNVVMGGNLSREDIPHEGIDKITLEQVKEAKARGEHFKLVGTIEKVGKKVGKPGAGSEVGTGLKARVSLEKISPGSSLADLINVKHDNNGIVFHTVDLGNVFVSGPGAGKDATAYGVINDLVEVVTSK